MKNIIQNSKILLISAILTACNATGQNMRKELPREQIKAIVDCVHHNSLQALAPVNSVIGSYAEARHWKAYKKYEDELFPEGKRRDRFNYSTSCEQFIDDNNAIGKKVLLEHPASPIYLGNPNVLHDAVGWLRTRIVRLLVENKVDVNRMDANGDTPLHVAAYHGSETMINVLIQGSANINLRSDTPLHAAVRNNAHYMIDVLCKYGADINLPNKNGNTPLHVVACSRHEVQDNSFMQKFLENGANVNAQNADGDTPLHLALRARNRDLAIVLLQAPNINVNLRNNSNETPLGVIELNRGSRGARGWLESSCYPDLDEMIKVKRRSAVGA